nr:Uncharacterised protein [Klebsiella pneumoniae]
MVTGQAGNSRRRAWSSSKRLMVAWTKPKWPIIAWRAASASPATIASMTAWCCSVRRANTGGT